LPFAPAAAAPLRRKYSLFLPGGAVRTAKSIAETARANPSSPCSRACCFNVNPGCRRAAAFSRCGVARVHGATPRRRGGGATRFDFDASRVALAVAVVPRAASTRWVRVACAVHASIASAFGGASASTLLDMLERATEAYREDYFVKRETLDAVLDAAASATREKEKEKEKSRGGRGTDDEGGEARGEGSKDQHSLDLSHETLTTLVATWILSPAIDDDAVDEFAAIAARETSAT